MHYVDSITPKQFISIECIFGHQVVKVANLRFGTGPRMTHPDWTRLPGIVLPIIEVGCQVRRRLLNVIGAWFSGLERNG